MTLTTKTLHNTIVVEDADGGIWWPHEATSEVINGELVLCDSPDGWSLHAPGASDDDIACGDAPYLACGEGSPQRSDYAAARAALALRLFNSGAPGTWKA